MFGISSALANCTAMKSVWEVNCSGEQMESSSVRSNISDTHPEVTRSQWGFKERSSWDGSSIHHCLPSASLVTWRMSVKVDEDQTDRKCWHSRVLFLPLVVYLSVAEVKHMSNGNNLWDLWASSLCKSSPDFLTGKEGMMCSTCWIQTNLVRQTSVSAHPVK